MIKGLPLTPMPITEIVKGLASQKAGGNFLDALMAPGDPASTAVPSPAEDAREAHAAAATSCVQPLSQMQSVELALECHLLDSHGRRHVVGATCQLPIESAMPHEQSTMGDSELVTSQWRLTPTGRLGQAFSVPSDVPVFGMPLSTLQGAIDLPLSGPLSASVPDCAVPGRHSSRGRTPTTPLANIPMHETPELAHEATTTGTAATTNWSTAVPWVDRLIRWLQQQGHNPAIWVRDYRLDKATTAQVVEHLRTQAREQGVELDRIVINAHEAWRTPDAHAQENT